MSDAQFTELKMVGRRVPDFSVETDERGHKHSVELPGTFEVGFLMEGVFRPIATLKAAGLLADIQRGKQAAQDAPSQEG